MVQLKSSEFAPQSTPLGETLALQGETLHLKGEKQSKWKLSEVHLTGMPAANANGEKLPMFIIEKYLRPRFSGIRHLPGRCRAQEKSWMRAELFEEWLRGLDWKIRHKGGKFL